MAGALPHETCRALTLPASNRGNPGRNRDREPEAQHGQRHTVGDDPTLPPFVLVVGASKMHLQDDYHLTSLTLKGDDSGGKHCPRNSYVNGEKYYKGIGWERARLVELSVDRCVFSACASVPRSRNAVQKNFALRKRMKQHAVEPSRVVRCRHHYDRAVLVLVAPGWKNISLLLASRHRS